MVPVVGQARGEGRAVVEDVGLAVAGFVQGFAEGVLALPEFQDGFLQRGETDGRRGWFHDVLRYGRRERAGSSIAGKVD